MLYKPLKYSVLVQPQENTGLPFYCHILFCIFKKCYSHDTDKIRLYNEETCSLAHMLRFNAKLKKRDLCVLHYYE